MTESAKTFTFVGVAALMVVVAIATRPRMGRDAEIFVDAGEPFYPALTDPSVPTALEVIEFNEAEGSAKPFLVQFKDGKWTIPSHHNYPADAADRLKKTAGSIIGLTKDSIVSNKKEDHAELGVVDPFEKGPEGATKGWGNRVKLRDKNDNIVADLIIGKDVPNKTGFKFVRVPGMDRVYAVQTKDLDLSIKFADWIDTTLLEGVSSFDIDKITVMDYNVDLRQGRVNNRGTIELTKDKDNNWQADKVPAGEETNKEKSAQLANAFADLKIVGVREKPPGLKPDLNAVEGQLLVEEMQNRGFYLAKNGGLYSNDGEATIETKEGLKYTLRFGGKVIGTSDEVTAGKDKEKAAEDKPEAKADEKDKKAKPAETTLQENRFLLLSVAFDESKFPAIPEPPKAPEAPPAKEADASKKADAPAAKKDEAKADKPADKVDEAKAKADAEAKKLRDEYELKTKDRDEKIKRGKERAEELGKRYANWFYVIPNDSFKKIRLSRTDLVGPKKPDEKKDGSPEIGAPTIPPPPALKKDEPKKEAEKPADKPAPAKEEPKPAEKKVAAPTEEEPKVPAKEATKEAPKAEVKKEAAKP